MSYTKEEIRAHRLEWVEALESGRYTQARSELRCVWSGNSGAESADYCCLGVACDISGLGQWKDPMSPTYEVDGVSSALLLPPAVSEWLGCHGDDLWLGDHTASQLNDQLSWDFKAIARRARRVWGL